jgi:hypothetical protein
MSRQALVLPCVFALFALPAGQAIAAPESPAKEACRQQEQADGKGTVAAKATCAVKALFQSRVRRRGKDEPVEMTVGSPPMQSEDSDTPGDGNWEINLALGADWGRDGHRIEFPVADINYGQGERWQFTLEMPYVSLRDAGDGSLGATSARGVGDATLGAKYRFYDNEGRGLSMALYPQLRLHTPGANDAVSEGRGFILPLILVSEFERFSVTANVGIEAAHGDRRTFASLGAGRRLDDDWALLAEVAGTDLNAADERRVALDVGVRRKVSDTQSLSMAIGRDVAAGGGGALENHLVLNYQRLFGEAP